MSMLPSLKNLAQPSALRSLWSYMKSVPGGGVIMGRLVGQLAPFTSTIRPQIVELERGFARVRMADRRIVRNHLSSIHAIALMNLGEATTGIAMLYTLPDGMRSILTHLEMDYLKKARGTITGECRCEPVETMEKREVEVSAELKDEAGEIVARAHARWLVGPAR